MRELVLTAQFAAIIVLFGDMLYSITQRSSRIQIQMIVLNFSTILMLIGYVVEMTADTLEGSMNGVALAYLGKPYALLSSLLFFASFCGRPIGKRNVVIMATLASAFPLIICTNEFHHLYYSTVEYNPDGIFTPLKLGHGPLYYLYMAAVIGTFLYCLVLTIHEVRRSKTREARHQVMLLFVMLGATVLGYLIYLTGYTGGYDTTMLGAFVGALLLTVLFFRYRIFDALTLAKDQSLQESDTGLLVVDTTNRVAYTNALVDTLLKESFTQEELLELDDGTTVLHRGDKVYEVAKKTVVNKGRTFGQTVEIRDITEKFNYSARLEQEVENRTREIVHIQRSIVTSFAGIVEARDNSTGVHIKRMAQYVEVIARSLLSSQNTPLELTEAFVRCLVDVAPLHDIGKLSIPDAILLKPDRLTDEEFEIIKTHTLHGARIIRECLDGVERPEYVDMAQKVAQYHHEKWNGQGYPCGLKGEEIPLAARITAVADVYDAVRSERCYKPPMDLAEARKVIEEGSGSHFDPAVVDAFLRALPTIEAI